VQFSVNAFDEPAYCSALVQCLSTERFEQYLIRCANDMPRALRLYFFNTSLSAELFQAISVLEVGLRNAMHRELSKQFGSGWYDRHDIGLSPESLRLTANAIRYLKDRRKEVSPGRVVAGLTLGFWIKLLAPGYKNRYEEFLWRPALHRAFPNAKMDRSVRRYNRQSVFVPLNDTVLELRNRIAYHEPIYQRDLVAEFDVISRVAGWIDSSLAETIICGSTFYQLYGKMTRNLYDRSYNIA
jgi:hypothetical protein